MWPTARGRRSQLQLILTMRFSSVRSFGFLSLRGGVFLFGDAPYVGSGSSGDGDNGGWSDFFVIIEKSGSLVRPKVVKSVHFCPTTVIQDDNGNLLVTEYGLCEYKDHQTLSMQEVPENSAPGQLPRTVDVVIEDDLADSCKPGDRVAIVGVYKALPGKSKGSLNGVFRTVLIANNVSLLNKEANAPIYSLQGLKRMKEIAKRNDTFDLLGTSLTPSIYGHLWIKKAVIYLTDAWWSGNEPEEWYPFKGASKHIATSYAELRDASANAKSGGGTLPITARTLETMIRLSTAHAKMKLRNEVNSQVQVDKDEEEWADTVIAFHPLQN